MSDSATPTPDVPLTEPFSDLKVPDEPGVWFCARHKGVKTRLRCGRCEKPICPKCTVMAPTGARCGDCASNRSSHIYKVGPIQLLVCAILAIFLGAFGALIVHAAQGISLWLVLYAPVVGPALGKVITRVTGGKRGPVLAGTVCGGLILGALSVAVLQEMWRARLMAHMPPELASAYAPDPTSWAFLILFLIFATGGAWWWLK